VGGEGSGRRVVIVGVNVGQPQSLMSSKAISSKKPRAMSLQCRYCMQLATATVPNYYKLVWVPLTNQKKWFITDQRTDSDLHFLWYRLYTYTFFFRLKPNPSLVSPSECQRG